MKGFLSKYEVIKPDEKMSLSNVILLLSGSCI